MVTAQKSAGDAVHSCRSDQGRSLAWSAADACGGYFLRSQACHFTRVDETYRSSQGFPKSFGSESLEKPHQQCSESRCDFMSLGTFQSGRLPFPQRAGFRKESRTGFYITRLGGRSNFIVDEFAGRQRAPRELQAKQDLSSKGSGAPSLNRVSSMSGTCHNLD